LPTKHPRIAVTNDPELADALASVAPYFAGEKTATIVHDLAIRGAEAVGQERRDQDESIERLVAASTGRDDSLDWEVLERIDEWAWGD
jgi:hypothetical protein